MFATHKSSITAPQRVTVTEDGQVLKGTEHGNVKLTPSFGYLELEVPRLTISTRSGALDAYRDASAEATVTALRNAGWELVIL